MVLSIGGRAAPKGVNIKISGGPCEALPCFPGIKHKKFFIQMAESLHVIHVQDLHLTNELSMHGGAFKYKGKNLRVLSDSYLGFGVPRVKLLQLII
jgi:hypothetical protein